MTLVIGLIFLKDTKGWTSPSGSGVDIRAAERLPDFTTAGGSCRRPGSLNKPAADRSAAGFVLAGAAHKLQHDLATMRAAAVLDQIHRLPRPSASLAFRTGICSDAAVSMVLTCAGMSSGPSVSWLQPHPRAPAG